MINAKQIIIDALECRLPPYRNPIDLGMMIDAQIDDVYRLMGKFQVEPVAIEIAVDHLTPRDAIVTFDKRKLAAFEIDLRPYRHADLTDDEWREVVLNEADRWWLYPPRPVREEEDRRRAAAIADIIARERNIEAALERARRDVEARERALDRAREKGVVGIDLHELEEAVRAARWQAGDQAGKLQAATTEREQAEAVRADAERRMALARWKRRRFAAPSLDRLVKAHRGYDRVTSQAWAQFDEDMKAFQQSIREGDRWYQ